MWKRWRAEDTAVADPERGFVLHRVPTRAERLIEAPREAVWSAFLAEQARTDLTPHHHLVGAPAQGLGAKSVAVGPPMPPFGMRGVMYSEVTGVHEGHWSTSEVLAGAWELTETFMLLEETHHQTLARVTGWWSKSVD